MPSLAITRKEVIELDMEGKLPRNLTNPILKDNVRLPVGGWLIAKFKANNPGRYCEMIPVVLYEGSTVPP